MTSLREAVERKWSGADGIPGLGAALALASSGFKAVSGIRNALYDSGALATRRSPVPVISVGNLTVGGTGKTPIVRWIVDLLREAGHRPAVVLRGYGGDETLLHRQWYPNVPVVEAARRLQGVREAAEAGATVAVCDDAFQHRRLARDLDIVLMSADDDRPVRLLPAGPYRELPKALRRADLVLVTEKGGPSKRTDAILRVVKGSGAAVQTHRVILAGAGWSRLSGDKCEPPAGAVLVVTGVGAPATVGRVVEEAIDGDAEIMGFPDHHNYSEADVSEVLKRAQNRPIVTTEKDAVKLKAHGVLEDRVYVVGLRVTDVEDEQNLSNRLIQVAQR